MRDTERPAATTLTPDDADESPGAPSARRIFPYAFPTEGVSGPTIGPMVSRKPACSIGASVPHA